MDPLYEIDIHKPEYKGWNYGYRFAKSFGNQHGGAGGHETKEEVIEHMRNVIKGWNERDPILDLIPEQVSNKNLKFTSFTNDITKAEILGSKSLNEWMHDDNR